MSHFCLVYPLIRKINENKKKRNINIDLGVLPSHDKALIMAVPKISAI